MTVPAAAEAARRCWRKTRYPTEQEALATIIRLTADKVAGRMTTEVLPCRAYECRFCWGWHLTKHPDITPASPSS